jgi:hypothetical protein
MRVIKLIFGTFCLLHIGTTNLAFGNDNDIKGVYGAVSESEWNIEVELKDNNIATIIEEEWLAGEYEDRYIKKTDATWSKNCKEVILLYNEIADTLVYDNNLTVGELGLEGGEPGLYQIKPFHPKSIIKDVKLWKIENMLKRFK